MESGVPPLPPRAIPIINEPDNPLDTLRAFIELVSILRVTCPWDKEQTATSLMPMLIEEAYEAAEAAEFNDMTELSKELGDLLLHVIMQAVIAEEHGFFTLNTIVQQEFHKLVHRHPHVFGELAMHSATDVKANWERLKKQEGRNSALEGIPRHLPALQRAQRAQEKAARVGFDWRIADGAWDKLDEELHELRATLSAQTSPATQAEFEEEFGDVLFSLVNVSRFYHLNAEQTLQKATNKFIRRFQRIEDLAAAQQKELHTMSLEEMDVLWNQAKEELRHE